MEADGSGLTRSAMLGPSGSLPTGGLISYCLQLAYDSVEDRIKLINGPHQQDSPPSYWPEPRITYDIASAIFSFDTIDFLQTGNPTPDLSHTYQTNIIDNARRKHLFVTKVDGGTNTTNILDLNTGIITLAPAHTFGAGEPCMVKFDAMDRIVKFQAGKLATLNLDALTWADLTTFSGAQHGASQPLMIESKTNQQVFIFGGGDGSADPPIARDNVRVDRLEANGVVTRMSDAPSGLKFGATKANLGCEDPSGTGEIIIFQSVWSGTALPPNGTITIEVWSYNPALDAAYTGTPNAAAYTNLTSVYGVTFPPVTGWIENNYLHQVACVPLPAPYNVIALMSGVTDNVLHPSAKSSLYLYKHAAASISPSNRLALVLR